MKMYGSEYLSLENITARHEISECNAYNETIEYIKLYIQFISTMHSQIFFFISFLFYFAYFLFALN